MMQETGIRRELEAVSLEAAGASLRSAVKTAMCNIYKGKRADATAIVGWGVASAQAGV